MTVLNNPVIQAYVERRIQVSVLSSIRQEAWDDFRAGEPGSLIHLLRLDLVAHEQAAAQIRRTQQICSGAERGRGAARANCRHISDLLEDVAAFYGNEAVWGVEREPRELEQIPRISEYVSYQMRVNTDSTDGTEAQDRVVQSWHDAGQALFEENNPVPLYELVCSSGNLDEEGKRIAAILAGRIAGPTVLDQR